MTSDKQLFKLADHMGINDLEINWLRDYDPDHRGPQILNLGSSLLGGTHWVATYEDWYFDSLGLPPPSYKDLDEKQYTSLNIQPSDEGHCGQYSMLWLYYAQKKDLDGFYSMFKTLNLT
jgi:hypothetical protein